MMEGSRVGGSRVGGSRRYSEPIFSGLAGPREYQSLQERCLGVVANAIQIGRLAAVMQGAVALSSGSTQEEERKCSECERLLRVIQTQQQCVLECQQIVEAANWALTHQHGDSTNNSLQDLLFERQN